MDLGLSWLLEAEDPRRPTYVAELTCGRGLEMLGPTAALELLGTGWAGPVFLSFFYTR